MGFSKRIDKSIEEAGKNAELKSTLAGDGFCFIDAVINGLIKNYRKNGDLKTQKLVNMYSKKNCKCLKNTTK